MVLQPLLQVGRRVSYIDAVESRKTTENCSKLLKIVEGKKSTKIVIGRVNKESVIVTIYFGSIPGRIKLNTLNLEFTASLLIEWSPLYRV